MAGWPLGEMLELKEHSKSVSALAIEQSGSRFISGSHDHSLRLWDFNGMDDTTRQSFRQLEAPCDDYAVKDLAFGHLKGTLDKVLVVPASSQAKVYDRDGRQLVQFAKGDSYLTDMRHTKGHCQPLNAGLWSPTDARMLATAANDSTVRFWDLEAPKSHVGILVLRGRRPGTKTGITVLRYTRDGKRLLTASLDGGIRVWQASATHSYVRPLSTIETAHTLQPGHLITDMQLAEDDFQLASRAMDGSLKFWDLRRLQRPVHVIDALPTLYDATSVVYGDHGRLVLTSCSSLLANEPRRSCLAVYRSDTFEAVDQVDLPRHSMPSRLLWHDELRQCLVGCHDGAIRVYYDVASSQKGAKLVSRRRVSSADFVVADSAPHILTPHALPLFRPEAVSLKRQREKARLDPVKSHRPELPMQGPGQGGRIGSNLTQHLIQHIVPDSRRDEDPRLALLKYAKVAAENPTFVAPAYKDSQPHSIFTLEDTNVDQDDHDNHNGNDENKSKDGNHEEDKVDKGQGF